MNDFVKYYFTYTTAEDQYHYFTGDTHPLCKPEENEIHDIIQDFRVIDGNLTRIKSDLPKEEVMEILKSRE